MIEKLTIDCKFKALNVIKCGLLNHSILPIRCAYACEHGIYLKYTWADKVLEIEVYNDLDITGVLSKDKEILLSWEITDKNGVNLDDMIRMLVK
jgi:hypothetical protein